MPQSFRLLGHSFELEPIDFSSQLPLVYQSDYRFYAATIAGQKCIVMQYRGDYLSIPRVQKHCKEIPSRVGLDAHCVLWLNKATTAQLSRFINARIPFFVNDKTVFLPFLGLRLDANAHKEPPVLGDRFTVATQCVFLWLLYNGSEACPIDTIANELKLSKASVSRALIELHQREMLMTRGKATRKTYYRMEQRPFWERGKQWMISPVAQTLYVENTDALDTIETFTAGEEALAHQSMLEMPPHPCRAIYKKNAKAILAVAQRTPDDLLSEDYTVVEVWRYDPSLFATAETDNAAIYDDVDLFSLYASLGDLMDDIRVLDEMDDLLEAFFDGNGD